MFIGQKAKEIGNKSKNGFTLVEILIVIALLGALIIGLLAALDPLEQIRRGQDVSLRNTASEFFNAVNRYYAAKGQFPWADLIISERKLSESESYIAELVNVGELKTNFSQRAGSHLDKIYLNSSGPTEFSVCFMPVSKSMQEDSTTIFDQRGNANNSSSCKSQVSGSGGVNCYICLQ